MVYCIMKSRIMESLQKHFIKVDCPCEAPGKESFGDIDIVAQGSIDTSVMDEKDLYELLPMILNSERLDSDGQNSKSRGDLMFHAAIPWPHDVPEEPYEPLDPDVSCIFYAKAFD